MENRTLSILVIEDEVLLLEAITTKLKLNNIEVIPCTSAEEALNYLATAAMMPDAIWLDYYLKDMNGMEFVMELKKNQTWAEIPVMVVSNSASDEKVHALEKLGVYKYILKAEYKLEDIINEMRQFVSEKSQMASRS